MKNLIVIIDCNDNNYRTELWEKINNEWCRVDYVFAKTHKAALNETRNITMGHEEYELVDRALY